MSGQQRDAALPDMAEVFRAFDGWEHMLRHDADIEQQFISWTDADIAAFINDPAGATDKEALQLLWWVCSEQTRRENL